jgi:hypothetical protein
VAAKFGLAITCFPGYQLPHYLSLMNFQKTSNATPIEKIPTLRAGLYSLV